MAILLKGKPVADAKKVHLAEEIQDLRRCGASLGLAIVLAGDDPASQIYAERLARLGKEIGVQVAIHCLAGDSSQEEVLRTIQQLNDDPQVSGILPMMPMPPQIHPDAVSLSLLPAKDVDMIHPFNAGLLALGRSRLAPCTPRAVMAILDYYNISLTGMRVALLGRSNVVGKPLLHLLQARNATVTLCHSQTRALDSITKASDIVIAAVGKPGMVTAAMVKRGAIVIDVGINEVDGQIVGDVAFDEVAPLAQAITPVPGGVGTVSTIMVMEAILRNRKN